MVVACQAKIKETQAASENIFAVLIFERTEVSHLEAPPAARAGRQEAGDDEKILCWRRPRRSQGISILGILAGRSLASALLQFTDACLSLAKGIVRRASLRICLPRKEAHLTKISAKVWAITQA